MALANGFNISLINNLVAQNKSGFIGYYVIIKNQFAYGENS